jgi:hypothetical protein
MAVVLVAMEMASFCPKEQSEDAFSTVETHRGLQMVER